MSKFKVGDKVMVKYEQPIFMFNKNKLYTIVAIDNGLRIYLRTNSIWFYESELLGPEVWDSKLYKALNDDR